MCLRVLCSRDIFLIFPLFWLLNKYDQIVLLLRWITFLVQIFETDLNTIIPSNNNTPIRDYPPHCYTTTTTLPQNLMKKYNAIRKKKFYVKLILSIVTWANHIDHIHTHTHTNFSVIQKQKYIIYMFRVLRIYPTAHPFTPKFDPPSKFKKREIIINSWDSTHKVLSFLQ